MADPKPVYTYPKAALRFSSTKESSFQKGPTWYYLKICPGVIAPKSCSLLFLSGLLFWGGRSVSFCYLQKELYVDEYSCFQLLKYLKQFAVIFLDKHVNFINTFHFQASNENTSVTTPSTSPQHMTFYVPIFPIAFLWSFRIGHVFMCMNARSLLQHNLLR